MNPQGFQVKDRQMAIEGIIGKKVGMTQVFAEDGALVPVTVIQAGPCLVVQKKTSEKDGYDAVQIGLVEKVSNRRITSAMRGHFEKAGVQPVKTLAEVPYSGDANIGDRVQVDIFKAGDSIDVVGQSKGKGFQGVVRRHGFGGGRATHGSMFHRAPGGIGGSSFPSRVWKNQHFPGHMGNQKVTARNLRVVKVDTDENLLLVRGSVPGPRGTYIFIRKSLKQKAVPAKK
jgi:large subunit ribosomal protein L3